MNPNKNPINRLSNCELRKAPDYEMVQSYQKIWNLEVIPTGNRFSTFFVFFWQSWLLSRRFALQRCLLQSSPGKCRNCAWNRPMGWPSSPYGSRRRAQIMKPKWAWGNSVGHVRPGNMRALPDDMAGRPLRVLTSPKDTVASNHRRGRAWVGSIYCDVLRFSWLFRDICLAPTICFFVWYHFLPANFAIIPLLGASNLR